MVNRYVLKGRVTDIYEKEEDVHISGAGKEAVMDTRKLGWFITVDGHASFYVGTEQPAGLVVGQPINIIIEPRQESEPAPAAAPEGSPIPGSIAHVQV